MNDRPAVCRTGQSGAGRGLPRPAPGHVFLASVELAILVVVAAAVAVIPRTDRAVLPGIPLVAEVAAAGHRLPVLVAPNRPGWNLVHIGAEQASVGTDPGRLRPAEGRPGTRYTWAPVWLPAGRSRLVVEHGGTVGSLTVDTGPAAGDPAPDLRGPDGPECASAALGQAIGATPVPVLDCPADRLSQGDAAALRALVRFIAARGGPTIGLVADGSARGEQAAATIRQEAQRHGLIVTMPGQDRIPLIVVSGWTGAAAAIRAIRTGHLAAQGSYLAPWLLTGPLLTLPVGQLIALRFDPDDPLATAYLAASHARFPGEPPTAVGYLGWLRAASQARPSDGQGRHGVRLYAASQIALPGSAAGHDTHGASWLPAGTITAITGELASSGFGG